jgi:hypothetical protein
MQEQATPQTPENVAPGFSLNDLRAIQQIISISSARGAFKAEEMTSVGLVYDRLTAFLRASEAAAEAAKGEETAPANTGN